MTHIEAMKLALDALNDAWGYGSQRLDDKLTKAIKALEEALKQEQGEPVCRDDGRCQYAIDSGAEGMGHCPKGKCVMPKQEQGEPVAWMNDEGDVVTDAKWAKEQRYFYHLYTTPQPAQKPLTGQKIIDIADKFDWDKDCAVRFARAIEAAHGITASEAEDSVKE